MLFVRAHGNASAGSSQLTMDLLSLSSLSPTLSIRYNLEGDLLFSVAKDSKPTVWYSSNGERLGTFNGHNGAIWCIDVNRILTTIY